MSTERPQGGIDPEAMGLDADDHLGGPPPREIEPQRDWGDEDPE